MFLYGSCSGLKFGKCLHLKLQRLKQEEAIGCLLRECPGSACAILGKPEHAFAPGGTATQLTRSCQVLVKSSLNARNYLRKMPELVTFDAAQKANIELVSQRERPPRDSSTTAEVEVAEVPLDDAEDTILMNAFNIHCPKCKCLVLKQGVAKKIAADQNVCMIRFYYMGAIILTIFLQVILPICSDDISAPVPPYNWVVQDMMAFENVGFTKPIPGSDVRYLSCADCDIGPIGYHPPPLSISSKMFLVAADRCRYSIPSS